MSAQRTLRLSLAVIASGTAVLLSWPYRRDFEYAAESPVMWLIYFLLGFALAVYVFCIFLVSLRTLFEHDGIERASQSDRSGAAASGREDEP